MPTRCTAGSGCAGWSSGPWGPRCSLSSRGWCEMPDAIETTGRSLGRKLGPLPLWVWLAGGVLVAAGGYYLISSRKGGAASPFANVPDLSQLGGGFGGGG